MAASAWREGDVRRHFVAQRETQFARQQSAHEMLRVTRQRRVRTAERSLRCGRAYSEQMCGQRVTGAIALCAIEKEQSRSVRLIA
jgi:hypothetical protein